MEENSKIGFDFWKRVFLLLDEQKMSQTELARKAGTTPQTISVARQKGSVPSVIKGDRIAKALGVPLDYLLYGDSAREVDPVYLSSVNIIKERENAQDIFRDVAKLNDEELRLIRVIINYMLDKR